MTPLLNRRSLIFNTCGSALSSAEAPAWALKPTRAPAATYQDFWQAPRELWLYRSETGEAGRHEYWRDGKLQTEAWFALLVLLRDVRAGIGMDIDPGVVDLVWAVQQWVYQDSGKRHLFRATDGARTEHTNRTTPGADPHSTHREGKAIDGRFEGIELARYARAARFFGKGGVGLYSAHVHVDTGKVRKWGF